MTTLLMQQVDEATRFVRARAGARAPTVGLILGSGLGPFADQLEDAVTIDYHDIPHMPVSSVEGHAGCLVLGHIEGVSCVAMKGRVHLYEGYDARTVTLPTRVLVQLGASTLIVTNAAGGITDRLTPGTLMVIRDHINLLADHPLRGPNDDRLGPRFPDMTHAYAPALRAVAHRAATRASVVVAEGVYAASSGPSYETPAEVEMLRRLGADATGMSTVPEVIVANHMGARVLGISCITNKAAGLGDRPLSHDEVTQTATRVRATFQSLLTHILREIGSPHDR